jgi:hypothetical protein
MLNSNCVQVYTTAMGEVVEKLKQIGNLENCTHPDDDGGGGGGGGDMSI